MHTAESNFSNFVIEYQDTMTPYNVKRTLTGEVKKAIRKNVEGAAA